MEMKYAEAVECLSRIKRGIDAIWRNRDQLKADLLELSDGKGWLVLGYDSWRACAAAEFNKSQSQVYKLLTNARVEKRVSHGKNLSIPERVARPLASAPLEMQADLWNQAVAAAGGRRPTEEQVRQTVEAAVESDEDEEQTQRLSDDYASSLDRWLRWASKISKQMERSKPLPPATIRRKFREVVAELEKEISKQA